MRIELHVADDPTIKLGVDGLRIVESLEHYEGPYAVIPTVSGLTLPTAMKAMESDVSVNPIPIGSVSNDAGGRTVSIG